MFPGPLRVPLRGDSADAAQTISLDIARIARGCCAFCCLIFDKGMVSNQNTGFPISESREELRLVGRVEMAGLHGGLRSVVGERGSEAEDE